MKLDEKFNLVIMFLIFIVIIPIISFESNSLINYNNDKEELNNLIEEYENEIFLSDRRIFSHSSIMEGENFSYIPGKTYNVIATFKPTRRNISYLSYGNYYLWRLEEPDSREQVLAFAEEFLINAYKYTAADSAKFSLYRYYRRTNQIDKALDILYFFKLSSLTIANHDYSYRELYEYCNLIGISKENILLLFISLRNRYPFEYKNYPNIYGGINRYIEIIESD